MKELISINSYRLHLRKLRWCYLLLLCDLQNSWMDNSRRKDYCGTRFHSVEQGRRGGVSPWTLPRAQSSGFFTWLLNGSKKSKRQELWVSLIFKTHLYSLVKVISPSTQGHRLGDKFSAWSCWGIATFKFQKWLHHSTIPLFQVSRLKRRFSG